MRSQLSPANSAALSKSASVGATHRDSASSVGRGDL